MIKARKICIYLKELIKCPKNLLAGLYDRTLSAGIKNAHVNACIYIAGIYFRNNEIANPLANFTLIGNENRNISNRNQRSLRQRKWH